MAFGLHLKEGSWTLPQLSLWGATFLFMLSGLVVSLSPELRTHIRSQWQKESRTLLSTAMGDLLGDGSLVKVIKYQTPQGIYLEIFGSSEEGARPLLDRIYLKDRHNGFFDFQGQATQLALADVDSDGSLELLAPTFDDSLSAHLNIYKYNPDFRRFEALKP